jgi:hypothetical protein
MELPVDASSQLCERFSNVCSGCIAMTYIEEPVAKGGCGVEVESKQNPE